MSSLVTQLLVAGACYDGDATFQTCALQPLQCTGKQQIFHSSRWLSLNDSMRAKECAFLENIKNIRAMGRCDAESERYICTSHKTACRFSATFQAYDSDCGLVDDSKPNSFFDKSYFPRCEVVTNAPSGYPSEAPSSVPPNIPTLTPSDIASQTTDILEDFCVWQFNECPKNKYKFDVADHFFSGGKPNCQCDQVKVGACISVNYNEEYFCSVSKEVCDTENGYSYLKAEEVESQLNITCKLCDKLAQSDTQGIGGNMPSSPATPLAKTPRPTPPPTPLPTPLPTPKTTPLPTSTKSRTGDMVVQQNEGSLETVQIIGIVIGTLVFVLLVIAIYARMARKMRQEKEIVENARDENTNNKIVSVASREPENKGKEWC